MMNTTQAPSSFNRFKPDAIPLLLLLLLGFTARALYLQDYLNHMPFALTPQNDARMYWELGLRIFREGWLLPNDGPFYQAPLYSYVLAALHHLGIHEAVTVLRLQLLLGVINTALVYTLARFALRPWLACLAGLLFGLSHYSLFFESKLLATTLGLFLLLMSFNLLLHWAMNTTKPRWRTRTTFTLSAIFLALAVLARPNFLFMLPFVLMFIAWQVYQSRAVMQSILSPLIFLIIFIIGVSPAPLRNGLVGGDWVFISANSGVTLYMGNNPTAQGALGSVPGLSNNIADQHQQSIALASEQAGEPLSPSEASSFWVNQTLLWVSQNPLDFAVLLFKKTLWALYCIPPAVNYSTHYESAHVGILTLFEWFSMLTLAMGWVGLILTLLQSRFISNVMAQLICAAIAGYFILVWVFYASDRFLASIVPMLSISAVLAARIDYQNRQNHSIFKRIIQPVAAFTLVVLLTFNPWLGWNARNEIGMGYFNTGVMYMQQNNRAQAAEAFEQGLNHTPNVVPMLLNLGVIYAQQGRLQDSTRLFERVLELDPDNQTARRNLQINRQRLN